MHETLDRTSLKMLEAGKFCESGAGYGKLEEDLRAHGIWPY